MNQDSVSCNGLANGSASVGNISGAGGIYTYLWDLSTGSQTGDTATNLLAGTYTVTVSDQNGCNLDTSIVVLEPLTLTADTTAQDSTSCNGLADGSASVLGIGGNGIYTYQWDLAAGGQVGDTATNLLGGIYTVTITDQKGCNKDTTIEVLQPNQISLTIRVDSSTCGNSDGGAYVDASGGSVITDYFYQWKDNTGLDLNNNDDSLNNVASSAYFVFVTDDNLCKDSIQIIVPEIGGPQVSDSVVNILCYGDSTGEIHITATGISPFSYSWIGPAGFNAPGDTSIVYNLDTGLYTVTVTDDINCNTTLDSIRISEPNFPLSIDTTIKTLTCNSDLSGAININVNNGTSPFDYSWTGDNGFTSTTQNISGLAAGVYVLNVIDDNSCKIINDSITITEPDTIIINETLIAPTCNNTDGSIVVNVTGGSTAIDYTYNWEESPSGNPLVGNATLTNIGPGAYQVTVQDDSSCSETKVITISTVDGPILADSIINITCNGNADGEIYLAVSNLSGVAYGVDWDLDNLIGSGDADGPDSDTLLNLPAGTYTVYVTDSTNGCVTISPYIVVDPGVILLTTSVDSVSCTGGTDGSLSVAATGGNLGYNYQWDLAAGGQVTDTATNLTAGTYTVTVTDIKGCDSDTSILLEEPNELLITSIWSDSISCNGLANGSASAIPSGGNAGYTYQWDLFAGGQTSDTATNLSPGTYIVTITDSKGCFKDTTITISEPDILAVDSAYQDSVSCNGLANGRAVIDSVSGGNGIYSYAWDIAAGGQTTDTASNLTAGIYTVRVSDQKGCFEDTSITVFEPSAISADTTVQDSVSCNGLANGSASVLGQGGNGIYSYAWNIAAGSQLNDTAINLAAGNYIVTITDQKGCFKDTSVTVLEPIILTFDTAYQDSVSCNGLADGLATVSVSGANGGFTYLWDATAASQTTAIASNLTAGTFRVVVSDQNNCLDSVDITVFEPNSISIYTSNDSVSCYGLADGSSWVDSITGGNGSFTYQWDANANNQQTDTASNLTAGTFNVTVTDQNNCSLDSNVVILQPDSLTVDTVSTTDPYCPSANDGSINLAINGGSLPITTSWTNVANTFTSTDQDISNLFIGTYIVTVTDNNGCNSKDTTTLSPIVEIVVNAGSDTLVCFSDSLVLTGSSTGTITPTLDWSFYNPTAGTDSSIATASSQVDISSFTQDSAQVYSFIYTVTEQSCTVNDTIQVNVAALPIASAGNDTTLGYNDPYILGGNPTGPVGSSYIWNNTVNFVFESDSIEPNPSIDVLTSQIYVVIVTDSNGCINSDDVDIKLIPDIIVPSGFSPNGDGINDTWIIQNLDQFDEPKVSVYNRWGSRLFFTDNSNENWDGGGDDKMTPVGTYYYIIEFVGYDGKQNNLTGPITIIR